MAAAYPILDECDVTPEGYYRHRPCGNTLDVTTVIHTVLFKVGGRLAGGGEVEHEAVPYCATCGPVPPQYGSPIHA